MWVGEPDQVMIILRRETQKGQQGLCHSLVEVLQCHSISPWKCSKERSTFSYLEMNFNLNLKWDSSDQIGNYSDGGQDSAWKFENFTTWLLSEANDIEVRIPNSTGCQLGNLTRRLKSNFSAGSSGAGGAPGHESTSLPLLDQLLLWDIRLQVWR